MATFTQDFDPTTPQGSDSAYQGDDMFRDDKTALNERYALEHIDLTTSGSGDSKDIAGASGRHNPGKVSAVYIGTTAQITALGTVYSGSLAIDTDTKELKIHNGTNWTTYRIVVDTHASHYAFSGARTTNQSLTGGTNRKISLNVDEYDYGSVFDHVTNYRFTVPVTGIWSINAQITLVTTAVFNPAVILYDGTNLYRGTCVRSDNGAIYSCISSFNSQLLLTAGTYLDTYCDCLWGAVTITDAFLRGYLITRS